MNTNTTIGFTSTLQAIDLLHDLYPEIPTCYNLVVQAHEDGILSSREYQYLIRDAPVWYNFTIKRVLYCATNLQIPIPKL